MRLVGLERNRNVVKALILLGLRYAELHNSCINLKLLYEVIREVGIDLFGDCLLFLVHGMLINALQHILCFMPHHFHCVFIGDIVCQHNGCEVMSERVEGAMGDACLLSHGVEGVRDLAWEDGEQAIASGFFRNSFLQIWKDDGRDRKISSACLGLRCFFDPFTIGRKYDRSSDMKYRVDQVHIIYIDAADFASTQAHEGCKFYGEGLII